MFGLRKDTNQQMSDRVSTTTSGRADPGPYSTPRNGPPPNANSVRPSPTPMVGPDGTVRGTMDRI